jgi:acyl-CoA reductase-like NAD-dependent aldehyde dehydrogenase
MHNRRAKVAVNVPIPSVAEHAAGKHTGNGHREGGTGALDFYTTWKSVYIDYSDKLQRVQIDTGE